MRSFALALGASAVLLAGTASAHFNMVMPPSPTASVDGKGPPPCGPDTTDGTVTPVTGGSQLPLSVNETVRHGGFYRVALALKSCKKDVTGMPKCFPDDNKVYDKDNMLLPPAGPGTSDHADIDPAPKFPILADGLFPHTQAADGTGPTYSGMVTIPNVACDRCTLQVIEFMTPHGSNGAAGFFYHHCADLKITVDPAKPVFDPGGAGGSGAGGSAAGGSAAGGTASAAGAPGTGGVAGGSSSGGTGNGTGGSSTGNSGTATTTAGTTTTTAGTSTGTSGAGGSGTVTTPGGGDSQDDGGCGVSRRTQGSAPALAALGLLLTLVRRRRAS